MSEVAEGRPIRRRSRTWRVGVVLLSVVTALLIVGGSPQGTSRWVPLTGSLLAAALAVWSVVQARSDRRAYEAALVARASAEAVAEERLALARDLHDLVSHGLGYITVRAATARRLSPDSPTDLGSAMAEIEEASRRATLELRRMLALLRRQGDVPHAPTPGLADIGELAAVARTNGLRVEVVAREDGAACSPGAGLVVYRVVQEALTNAARHAGPTRVDVRYGRIGDRMVVEVRDEGRSPGWVAEPGAGHGLRGLRERIEAMHGELRTATTDAGGFHLTAEVPDPPGSDG